MSRSPRDQYEEAQDRLDEAHRQDRAAWNAFTNDPSLPLPQGTNVDDLQETASRLRMMLDEEEDEEDDESDAPMPDAPAGGFGQGPAYSFSLRSTQTGGFDGGSPNANIVTNTGVTMSNTPSVPALSPDTTNPSSNTPLRNNEPESRHRVRFNNLLNTMHQAQADSSEGEDNRSDSAPDSSTERRGNENTSSSTRSEGSVTPTASE